VADAFYAGRPTHPFLTLDAVVLSGPSPISRAVLARYDQRAGGDRYFPPWFVTADGPRL
jgi:hypothetical protein